MSNVYANIFKLNLEQDLAAGQIDPDAEAEAMQSTLDPGTDAKQLGADGGPNAEIAAAVAKNNQAMKQALTGWIQNLEEFVEFLNGLDGNSVQSQLKNAVPDTIMDKIRSSEMKKISRVSMEVAGLKEIFRGYLASSDDAKYKFV
jgi:hypothetical protein